MELVGVPLTAKLFTTSSFCGGGVLLSPKFLNLQLIDDFTISGFVGHELWKPRLGDVAEKLFENAKEVSKEKILRAVETSKYILCGSTPIQPLAVEMQGQEPLIIPTEDVTGKETAAILFDVEIPNRKTDPHQNIQYFFKKITEKIIVIFLVIASVIIWTKTVNVTQHAWKTSSPNMNAQVANVRGVVSGNLDEITGFVATEQAKVEDDSDLSGLDGPYKRFGN